LTARRRGKALHVMSVVGEAAAERLSGERPGRWRAIVAAIVAGAAVALLVYRLLRSNPGGEDGDGDGEPGDDGIEDG
jgi:hypothetical protein